MPQAIKKVGQASYQGMPVRSFRFGITSGFAPESGEVEILMTNFGQLKFDQKSPLFLTADKRGHTRDDDAFVTDSKGYVDASGVTLNLWGNLWFSDGDREIEIPGVYIREDGIEEIAKYDSIPGVELTDLVSLVRIQLVDERQNWGNFGYTFGNWNQTGQDNKIIDSTINPETKKPWTFADLTTLAIGCLASRYARITSADFKGDTPHASIPSNKKPRFQNPADFLSRMFEEYHCLLGRDSTGALEVWPIGQTRGVESIVIPEDHIDKNFRGFSVVPLPDAYLAFSQNKKQIESDLQILRSSMLLPDPANPSNRIPFEDALPLYGITLTQLCIGMARADAHRVHYFEHILLDRAPTQLGAVIDADTALQDIKKILADALAAVSAVNTAISAAGDTSSQGVLGQVIDNATTSASAAHEAKSRQELANDALTTALRAQRALASAQADYDAAQKALQRLQKEAVKGDTRVFSRQEAKSRATLLARESHRYFRIQGKDFNKLPLLPTLLSTDPITKNPGMPWVRISTSLTTKVVLGDTLYPAEPGTSESVIKTWENSYIPKKFTKGVDFDIHTRKGEIEFKIPKGLMFRITNPNAATGAGGGNLEPYPPTGMQDADPVDIQRRGMANDFSNFLEVPNGFILHVAYTVNGSRDLRAQPGKHSPFPPDVAADALAFQSSPEDYFTQAFTSDNSGVVQKTDIDTADKLFPQLVQLRGARDYIVEDPGDGKSTSLRDEFDVREAKDRIAIDASRDQVVATRHIEAVGFYEGRTDGQIQSISWSMGSDGIARTEVIFGPPRMSRNRAKSVAVNETVWKAKRETLDQAGLD